MGPVATDPFELLGVPARFDLDKAEIEARQRDLSKALHPDRFATASAVERRAALNKAMAVNEAVRTLKNPVSRGTALLTRVLGPGAASETPEVRVPPSLLMEVMEWREELSNALSRRDQATVTRIAQTAAARRELVVSELTQTFAALTHEPGAVTPADANVVTAAERLAMLKYFERLAEEVRRIEDELADA